jgi:hypothetical protein
MKSAKVVGETGLQIISMDGTQLSVLIDIKAESSSVRDQWVIK